VPSRTLSKRKALKRGIHMSHRVFFPFKNKRKEKARESSIASPERSLVTHGERKRKRRHNISHTVLQVEEKSAQLCIAVTSTFKYKLSVLSLTSS